MQAGILLYSSALRRHVVVELGSINDQTELLAAVDGELNVILQIKS